MIDRALSGSRRYWLWLIFLLALFGVGFLTFVQQRLAGAEVSGMSRDVIWGFFIANYTFLVGVAASAVMVVLPYYLHNRKEFGALTALGEFLAVAAVAMALLFIVADLGQPFRMFNMFLYPTPNSPFFWNAIILPVYLGLNLIVAWLTLDAERKELSPAAWLKILILLSIPWAISIHTVTSFVYAGLVARPFWNTAILTPRFLASAFASGPALLIILALAAKRYGGYAPGESGMQKLATIVTYAMITNLFLVMAEVFVTLYGANPAHVEHLQYMYFGLEGGNALVPWSWLSLLLGIASVALLLWPKVRANERYLALACAGVFVATWIDKGLCLVVGGFVPSPLGKVTEYLPALPEVLIALGIYAAGLLIVTVLYKIALGVKKETAVDRLAVGH